VYVPGQFNFLLHIVQEKKNCWGGTEWDKWH